MVSSPMDFCSGWGYGDEGVRQGDTLGLSSSPQASARGGYFHLGFLAGEAGLGSSSSPSLFLAGDLNRSLSQLVMDLLSCALLSFDLSLAQSWTPPLSPGWSPSSSPRSGGISGLMILFSSSPKVNLLILLRLNSALLFSSFSSPHLCTNTASRICLVSAVWVNLTGLRWKLGSHSPPW